jgi:hypothetical protein
MTVDVFIFLYVSLLPNIICINICDVCASPQEMSQTDILLFRLNRYNKKLSFV